MRAQDRILRPDPSFFFFFEFVELKGTAAMTCCLLHRVGDRKRPTSRPSISRAAVFSGVAHNNAVVAVWSLRSHIAGPGQSIPPQTASYVLYAAKGGSRIEHRNALLYYKAPAGSLKLSKWLGMGIQTAVQLLPYKRLKPAPELVFPLLSQRASARINWTSKVSPLTLQYPSSLDVRRSSPPRNSLSLSHSLSLLREIEKSE